MGPVGTLHPHTDHGFSSYLWLTRTSSTVDDTNTNTNTNTNSLSPLPRQSQAPRHQDGRSTGDERCDTIHVYVYVYVYVYV